jgi:quercetin dioxygenase-like cupin family protein
VTEGLWKPVPRPLMRPGTQDVSAAPVYRSSQDVAAGGASAQRYIAAEKVPPLLGTGSGQIVALRLGPHGAIDEHSADEDIVVLTCFGEGRSRVGGKTAPWITLSPGEAVLWPAGDLHLLEAGPEGLRVRVVHFPTAN